MGHVEGGDIALHISNERLEVVRRKIFLRQDQYRRTCHQTYGRKVHVRLVGEVRIERDRGGMGSHVTHLDRVAVGGGARRSRRGGRAAGTERVLDDDGLTEAAGHVIADDAGNHVGRAAGSKRYDQGNRASRIVVGLRSSRAGGKAERDKRGKRAR